MSRSADDEQSETDPGWQRARHQLFAMIMEGRSFSGRERNCCFLNTGQERFATISAVSGLDFPDDARAIAVTDWDRDGDQDLWISNRNAPRLRFMRNESPSKNHFIALRLEGDGTTTNRDAIGARVAVETRNRESPVADPERAVVTGSTTTLIQTLRAGEGFLSQSSKWLHFGLGAAESIERVTVHWPGGKPQTFVGLEVDRRYRLSQGQANARLVPSGSPAAALQPAEPTLPAETRAARVVFETRVPMPSINYTSAAGTVITQQFESGAPVLVNLWASWCQPCVDELTDLASNRQRLERARVQVISLSVDQLGQKPVSVEEVKARLRQIHYPYAWGYIDAAQMDSLQELHNQFFFLRRPLPLPSSLLVDGEGRLSAIYRGPVSVDQVLEDVGRSASRHHDAAGQAACFPGTSLNHPRVHEVAQRTDLLTRYRVAAWLEARGRYHDAVEHFSELAERDPSWALPQSSLAKLYLDQNQLERAERLAVHALSLDPQSAIAHNTLGLICSRRGDPKSAESHFREAIRLDARLAGAYNNLGIVLALQGDIAAAGRFFERAVQIDDQFAEAHANVGNVYAARGDVQRAIKHYQRAIEIDPQNVDPYNNLGTMFGRLGDIERAIKYYRHALRADPENQDARRNLDRALKLWNSEQPTGDGR